MSLQNSDERAETNLPQGTLYWSKHLTLVIMPTLTLKNVPEDVHRRLRQHAERVDRSLDSEILVRLKRTLDEDMLVDRIRTRRNRMRDQGVQFVQDDIRWAIEEGRS